MNRSNSTAPSTGKTRWYMRLVFGLAAFGMGVQWFDRLDRIRGGATAGWDQVWNWVALYAMPFGVAYFVWRAAGFGVRHAEPGAAADGGGMTAFRDV